MNPVIVEAVWVWKYQTAAFKAAYGRLPGNAYTKDYLQASGICVEVFENAYPALANSRVELRYEWPGGAVNGHLRKATDYQHSPRLNLSWETNNPPLPWCIHLNPSQNTTESIPGDPSKSSEGEADSEFTRLENRDLEPYLIAIKLLGEEDTLHVRAYLKKPNNALQYASTLNLPPVIQDAIEAMPSNHGCTALYFGKTDRAAPAFRAQGVTEAILRALNRSRNVLLVGPPGCGKTVALEDLQAAIAQARPPLMFDTSKLHPAWHDPLAAANRVRTVVFHPGYAYEEFVMGLYPISNSAGSIDLVLRSGPLLSLSHWASAPGNGSVLIVDEFNRGNPASIFGDTLALLDEDQRSDPANGTTGAIIDRAHSEVELHVPPDFTTPSGTRIGAQISFPKNLYIVAAMNSSDRSVAPLDAALRRRFTIVRVDPDYDLLASRLGVDRSAPRATHTRVEDWTAPELRSLCIELLSTVNGRIESILGSDFSIGHAAFWHLSGLDAENTLVSLCAAFDSSIVGSLRMTFSDREEELAAVLNAQRSSDVNAATIQKRPDLVCQWVHPTGHLEHVGLPRLRMSPTIDMSRSEALDALLATLD